MNLRPTHALFSGLLVATIAGCDRDSIESDIVNITSDVLLTEDVIDVNVALECHFRAVKL